VAHALSDPPRCSGRRAIRMSPVARHLNGIVSFDDRNVRLITADLLACSRNRRPTMGCPKPPPLRPGAAPRPSALSRASFPGSVPPSRIARMRRWPSPTPTLHSLHESGPFRLAALLALLACTPLRLRFASALGTMLVAGAGICPEQYIMAHCFLSSLSLR
jgi:hypothetical protein